MMFTMAFGDGLLLASLAGTAVLLVSLAIARLDQPWPARFKHTMIVSAMFAQMAVAVLVPLWASTEPRCRRSMCDAVNNSGEVARAQEYYTVSAAGKFPDLAAAIGAEGQAGPAGEGHIGWLVVAWLIGVVLSLAATFRKYTLAWGISNRAERMPQSRLADRLAELAARVGLVGEVRLARDPRITVPAVSGLLRSTLLVPPQLETESPEAVEMVLLHELAHVRYRDALTCFATSIVASLFWFNPAMWVACRRIRDLQEMAADSFVLRNGVRSSSYGRYLLDSFRRAAAVPDRIPAMLHSVIGGCQVEIRLRAIVSRRVSHQPPSRLATMSIVVVLLAAAPVFAVTPSVIENQVGRASMPDSTAIDRRVLNSASLDSILRPIFINRMADRYIAGAAIAVVHEGRLVYSQGFGRREIFAELPVDAERTIWRIGSITKVLTAVAILQLVDRGLIDLDADVNGYLKEFKVPGGFAEPVTVRHLLTHTAGFDQIGLGRHAQTADGVRPLGEFLRENLIRIRAPGQITTYDTYAITLLGYLVEQVSGLEYEEYLKRHVFNPLGMERSGITVPDRFASDVAVGYGFAGSWEAEPWEYMNTGPASTVNSTAADMARFAIMLLDGGQYKGVRVLSPHSAQAMMTRQFTNHPDQPGFSFTMFEDRSYAVPGFSHGGSMAGFGTFLFLVPEHRLGVFVATNQESGTMATVALTALMKALFPGAMTSAQLLMRLENGPDPARFAGRYANSMHHHTNPETGWRRQVIELAKDSSGRLMFGGAPAYPVGQLAFQRDDGVLLTFRVDGRGEITHFFVNQTVYERLPDI